VNPHVLQQKSAKQPRFPELEDKFFVWFREIEMQHGVLIDDLRKRLAGCSRLIRELFVLLKQSIQISHSLADFHAGQRRR
jgi:hypothetical protein